MTRFIWLTLVMLIVACPAIASDITLVDRADVRGGQDYLTLALVAPEGQFWIYNYNDPNGPLYELGKLVPVHQDKTDCLMLGGYLAYFSGTNRLYVRPFLVYTATEGDLRLRARTNDYVPLGEGPNMFWLDEISLTAKISDELRIGPAARATKCEGQPWKVGAGGILEYQSGRAFATARYTGGEAAVRDFRGELQYRFSF